MPDSHQATDGLLDKFFTLYSSESIEKFVDVYPDDAILVDVRAISLAVPGTELDLNKQQKMSKENAAEVPEFTVIVPVILGNLKSTSENPCKSTVNT